jgi:sarcosine oxidase subunit alpha
VRIAGYGRVDRAISLPFSFDGRLLTGHPGDTLASALIANDVRIVARSFKYHRPRGILTAGPEEPNALVQIGSGAARVPNVRATVQELFEGLEATGQNAWPGLRFDMMEVNDLLAPFLGAGFYYKTFMWPRSFWEKVYEPAIRRAAGLGSFTRDADPHLHEKAFAHCDLLVIGAGPAGLTAALTAAEAGADVILADEGMEPGGRLLAEAEQIGGAPAMAWVAATLARLRALPNVRLMPRTTVTGVFDHGSYGALERVSEHLADPGPDCPRDCFWRIRARAAVLAAGAIERPVAFPANDRPGVMTAGALRAYLHRFGVVPGRSVAVFATNDDAHRTAHDLAAAGVKIAAVIDARPDATFDGAAPFFPGSVVTGTTGRYGLRAIRVRTPKGARTIQADVLGVSGGWTPTIHLTCHLGARPVWDEGLAAFLPAPGAVPGLHPAGACAGALSTAACLEGGQKAALAALADLGLTPRSVPLPAAGTEAGGAVVLWEVKGRGRAWLDLQNDVTTKDVRLAAREGYASVEHMKRYTTQGMAPDQGRTSNLAALALLAEAAAVHHQP